MHPAKTDDLLMLLVAQSIFFSQFVLKLLLWQVSLKIYIFVFFYLFTLMMLELFFFPSWSISYLIILREKVKFKRNCITNESSHLELYVKNNIFFPERWNLINAVSNCLFTSSWIKVHWHQYKQLKKNILGPNIQMPNMLSPSKSIKSPFQMLSCIYPKLCMLSSQSFHQPDAQVDRSFNNYLSDKESYRNLKQQLPWKLWPKC